MSGANLIFNAACHRRKTGGPEKVRGVIENWLSRCRGRTLTLLGNAGSDSSLKGRIVRNASWVGVSYGSELVLRFGSSLIVTRLLEPSVFGLIATVSIFLTIVMMLSDLGVRPIVLTHKRGDDPDFLSSTWVLQIFRGIVLTLLMAAMGLAWHIAQQRRWIEAGSYADPMLPGLLAFVGLCLMFGSFGSINEFRLARHLEQGAITRMDLMSKTVTTIANIVLAFLLRSVWALAIPMVLGAIIRSALSMRLPGPKMRFRVSWSDLKEILGHSRWIAVTSLLTVITLSADKLIIGYVFGLTALGIYSIAFALFDAVQNLPLKFNSAVSISVLKALENHDPEAFRAQYYRFRLPIDLYSIVFGLGFAIFGQLMITFMYDPRYASAGHYLQIFGIALLLLPFAVTANILIAAQRFKYTFFVTSLKGISFFVGLAVCAYFKSLTGVVFVVGLQRLPEILVYLLAPGSGIPFSLKRDGVLLGLAALVTVGLALRW
jgi:O-antigen/teichoic acid export membrane protein